MKHLYYLLALILLSHGACKIGKPKASRYEAQEKHQIMRHQWQVSCSIIDNAMPGSGGKSYGIVSLYCKEVGPVFSPLKLEKVWFYQEDSLIGTWKDFDRKWLNPNDRHLHYYCRNLGAEAILPCDKTILRFRSLYGPSYTVALPGPRRQVVH